MLRFVVQWLIPIALAIFAWVDCLLTPRPYVRMLPKPAWAVLIAVPYFGALLWIISGRAAQPHDPRRRATDAHAGMLNPWGRGTHQARPRIVGTGLPTVRYSDRGTPPVRPGNAPSAWAVPPDDDPEFLRRLGEQLKRDRPEN
ncbi:MAG: hypothetical protein AUG49_01220 [Catenulispora sp. 13_1_20CM_3_70_7]|nr:PLDc_N domain-containing protein [Catenulisporales bacterium]OLE28876.1 MAG: hypothetical protein AUG49_01220 [Catenulispora sp. 13_1_20CM_3_70_7]